MSKGQSSGVPRNSSNEILAFAANQGTTSRRIENISRIRHKLELVADPHDSSAALLALTEAVRDLDCLKDHKCGISWHESVGPKGSRVLVRDASRQTADDKKQATVDHGEKYAMQLLNQTRGAFLLLDQDSSLDKDKKNQAKRQLMVLAEMALRDDSAINNFGKEIKNYNHALVAILQNTGMKQVEKKIAFAKEMGNFQDEHMHMVTKTSAQHDGKTYKVYEAAEKLDPLTEKQKLEYGAIAALNTDQKAAIGELQAANETYEKAKSGRIRKLFGTTKKEKEALEELNSAKQKVLSANVPLWFAELPEYKRDLIAANANKIASGQYVLPTQLLGDVTGLRNAYKKITAIGEGTSTPKVLGESIHSGAPASLHPNKGLRQGITDDNVARLKEIGGANIILNNLMSKVKGREDISLFPLLEKYKDQTVTTPVNRWRMLAGRGGEDTAKLGAILIKLGNAVRRDQSSEKDHKAIANFLMVKKPGFFATRSSKAEYVAHRKGSEEALAKMQNDPRYQAFRAAVDAKNVVDRNGIEKRDNRNIFLNAKMQVVVNALCRAMNKCCVWEKN